MAEGQKEGEDHTYEVRLHAAGDLSQSELATCVAIIARGDAVDPESAAEELPKARTFALARKAGAIVGVGAIKRIRCSYAAKTAGDSAVVFPPETPELGYIAVDEEHRG